MPRSRKELLEKSFRFVSILKCNRNLNKNGRKLNAGSYGCRHRKRSHRINKAKGHVKYSYVDAGWLNVSDLGKLHVIFSRKNSEPRVLGLVTDDPKLSSSQMIRVYNDRWSIEVFFKGSKQLLELGQYQNVSLQGSVTHLHLVCFACVLLTHAVISREGAQGNRKSTARLSTADLQNQVRRIDSGMM